MRKHLGWYLTGYPAGSEVRAKASLVAMLLEAGEENPAVLLARSTLPDELVDEALACKREHLVARLLDAAPVRPPTLGIPVKGIGPAKLDQYGDSVLRVLGELANPSSVGPSSVEGTGHRPVRR